MSCPKNIINKKFLLWRWHTEGSHYFKLTEIGKFMYSSTHFMTTRICQHCFTKEQTHFTSMEDLIREGIDHNILNNITPNKPYILSEYIESV